MIFLAVGLFSQEYSIRHAECICWILFYKLCLPAVVILLLVVVMMDFTSRIMLVLTDGALVCGIVVLLWPMMKEQNE